MGVPAIGSTIKPFDAHLDQHDRVSIRWVAHETASPDRLCGPDRVIRT